MAEESTLGELPEEWKHVGYLVDTEPEPDGIIDQHWWGRP